MLELSGLAHLREMQFHMLRLCHHLQVFWPIIPAVAVNMMDDFASLERPAQHLFGDDSVFMPTEVLCI
jgi:hypothetical protein